MTFISNLDLDEAPEYVVDGELGYKLNRDVEVAKAADPKQAIAEKRSLILLAIACFVVAVMIASSVSGQEANKKYDLIEINPRIDTPAGLRTMKAETRNFASTGRGNLNAVRAYFEQYVPGKMTAVDGANHLSELVSDINGYLDRANRGGRPEIARGLSSLAFRNLSPIATGNYRPAARIAAVAIISGLNSRPLDISGKRPPVPLNSVLPILVSLYEDESNADGLRAAALQGIHRHAMYSFQTMPADAKAKLAILMNDLLDSEAPQGRDPAAHAFLQRYAVDILDYTGTGDDPSLGMKLVSISTEPKSLEMIALHSASKLATISKSLENKIDDPSKVLWSWTVRTLTAFENEINRIEGMRRRAINVQQPQDPSERLLMPENGMERRRVGGGGGGGGGSFRGRMSDGMMDAGSRRGRSRDSMLDDTTMMDDLGENGRRGREMPSVIQDAEIVASRRKLNFVLQQVHLGVTGSPTAGMPGGQVGGLLAIADESTKKEIQHWAELMRVVVSNINDSQIEHTEDFLIALRSEIEPLEDLVSSMNHKVNKMGEMKKEDAMMPKNMIDGGPVDGGPVDVAPVDDGVKDQLENDLLDEDLLAEPVLLP